MSGLGCAGCSACCSGSGPGAPAAAPACSSPALRGWSSAWAAAWGAVDLSACRQTIGKTSLKMPCAASKSPN
eukprot:10630610-Lingulodinium_polyedra.AAC.1